MSVTHIGPVLLESNGRTSHWDPTFSISAHVSPQGSRSASIGGYVTWTQAQQLSELVTNPERQVNIGGDVGVLEYIYTDDQLLGSFRGWYLLQSADISSSVGDSLEGLDGPVPFTLSAVYLGDQRQPVISRTARAKASDLGVGAKTLLVNPLWDDRAEPADAFVSSPGGTLRTREYDSSFPYTDAADTGTTRDLVFYENTISDNFALVALTDFGVDFNSVPRWLSDRGSDVRAIDRSLMREVYGPSHPFASTSDLMVTNGLVRFRVGPVGLLAFVQVEAYHSGAWVQVGYLSFATLSTDALLGARLVSVDPDYVAVVLTVRHLGEVTVSLRRGERMLGIQHGSGRSPLVTTLRRVAWLGTPPAQSTPTLSNDAGKFGTGLSYSSNGVLQFPWPRAVAKTGWAVAGWWVPASGSGSQGASTLFQIWDLVAEQSVLKWNPTGTKLQWVHNGVTLQTGSLTFTAGQPLFFCASVSATGRTLTIKAPSVAVQHFSDATLSGGTDENFNSLIVGGSATQIWGSGTWGSGTWGGTNAYAGGVMDNVMLMHGSVTNAEADALAAATGGSGALPTPEGRMVLHVHGDVTADPLGSVMTSGRRFEATAEGGSTRLAQNGLTRALVALDSHVLSTPGLAVKRTATALEVAAVIATTDAGDDITDYQSQFAAESHQQLLVR